jgi:predicted O-methyltransferase YrrM
MTTTHISTLNEPRVSAALARMFAAAERDDENWKRAFGDQPSVDYASATAQQRADLAAEIYMPVSIEGGRLLYSLVRATRPKTIVEFGTSFGISTLHLAAAVRDNGMGHVVTTELSASKAASARATFAETGLDDLITVLEGDALETLPPHVADGVEFVLLDGWKHLYLPVLQLLEPALAPGTLVIGDDAAMKIVQPYLGYVRDPANGYQSVLFPVEDGMEISCRL